MSDTEWENQGTGLGDVFDILAKTPSERLVSLTIQLGESPEDIIVAAMSLLVLQREEQALKKLQMLRDNPLANHLSEKCHTSGGKLDDFGAHCGRFQTHTMESMSLLARVFKVLAEQRLCEPLVRNLAYRRAISSDCSQTRNCSHLEYFIEEAKVVCGPQLVEEMCSAAELPDGENTSLKVSTSQDESSSVPCLPSTLQESPSDVSYPTHLEISIPPTVSFQEDKGAAATPNSAPDIGTEANLAPGQAQSPELPNTPTERSLLGAESSSMTDETLKSMSSSLQSNIVQNKRSVQPNKSSTETKITLPSAKSIIFPKMSVPKSLYDTEEEEEEIFYAFVILHAPEDAEQAEHIKEKLEKAISGEGATFSEEFAVLGKSTLRCVEDAINNSAFTFLLLTRNFNTKMLEMKTNIALINSINKTHKFNTVIPLLPENNCVPRADIPIVLQTLIPLEEKKNFEKKLQKALTPARIKKQRSIWTEEQRVRRLNRLRLQEVDRRCMEKQHLPSSHEGGDGRALWPPQANIHIENANYIMIGNDSTMTVGGSSSIDG